MRAIDADTQAAVPLFWPRRADEKPPGLAELITPTMAVASAAVLSVVPDTAVPAVLWPCTAVFLAPKARPSTPAPVPATAPLL